MILRRVYAACLYLEAKEFKKSSSSRRAQHDPLPSGCGMYIYPSEGGRVSWLHRGTLCQWCAFSRKPLWNCYIIVCVCFDLWYFRVRVSLFDFNRYSYTGAFLDLIEWLKDHFLDLYLHLNFWISTISRFWICWDWYFIIFDEKIFFQYTRVLQVHQFYRISTTFWFVTIPSFRLLCWEVA